MSPSIVRRNVGPYYVDCGNLREIKLGTKIWPSLKKQGVHGYVVVKN